VIGADERVDSTTACLGDAEVESCGMSLSAAPVVKSELGVAFADSMS
jgi:hypothetical protein